MALVTTEVQLQSHGVNRSAQGKKNRCRRVTQDVALCKNKENVRDECEELYEAAKSQLEQEMKAAGLEGSLPMTFGSGSRSATSRKRKRLLDTKEAEDVVDKVAVGEMEAEEEEMGEEDEVQALGGGKTMRTGTAVADKVRVVYGSDGEVVEQVVDQVEVVAEAQARKDGSSVSDVAHKKKRVSKKKKKYPVAKDVLKFYMRRHTLFEKFEDGIQLDHESWFSVTPQAIAEHIAMRLSCDVVLDPFAGCGGNVIQLAMTCKQVIAIDIDPVKIRMAKHNAAIYGVADKIEWIVGNSIDLLPSLRADVVFLSPPWGGVDYSRTCFSLNDMLVKGVSGLDLFAKVRKVSKNIAYYLPRGTPMAVLEALTPGEPVECENIFLNQQRKVVTAYYGDLVARDVPDVPAEEDRVQNEETVDA
ncbi:unnamed protein product [Hyaloperonospora brassicae]|uniref:Trimethylguanosine synthase n=1 Tax=Hyaloperonospora brassicae TaxID=162125 RepID=A0AAV0TNK3_HYABA|nr:unnamed protein product [Hyaloperonospora brassicae]